MIDIHTHMLPAVDDGAADTTEALHMLKQAADAGTKGIIFTPHMNCEKQKYSCAETKDIFNSFAAEIKEAGLPLHMWFGGEIFCNFQEVWTVIDKLKSGELPTINGTRYVLIEMDYEVDYEDMLNTVRELIRERFWPVVAHVERYGCIFKKNDRIRELIHQGAYIQINAKNMFGGRFDRRRRWCLELLDKDLVHFVATDCHDESVRVPGDLARVAGELIELLGEEETYRILEINPERMLQGEYID